MDIKGNVTELQEIDIEIKRLSQSLKQLRERKKLLEKKIIAFLDSNDQPGVKYNNVALVIEEKNKCVRKKPDQKKQDCIDILKKYGLNKNADELMVELSFAMKGYSKKEKKIKMRKIKQK